VNNQGAEVEREFVGRRLAVRAAHRTRTSAMLGSGVCTLFDTLLKPGPPSVVRS
jgi:hypothetical protein